MSSYVGNTTLGRGLSIKLPTSGLLCGAVALCAIACAPREYETVAETSSRGGTLRLIQEAPRSLDPLASDSVYESLPINQIFDTLVAYDPSLTVVPNLAETWTISKDNTEFVFTLREDVRFHDGRPLITGDVIYSICRQLRPKQDETSLAYSYLKVIDGAAEFAGGEAEYVPGLHMIDARTLRIRLTRPYASFLEVLAMDNLAIVPEELVRQVGDETFGRSPIGTGPFRLVEWDGASLLLEANDDYHAGRPHLDAVRILFLGESEPDFGAKRFMARELDVIEPPTDSLAMLANDQTISLHRYQELSLAFLGLNTRRRPLDRLWLRQAVAHAIDRDALVDDAPEVRRVAAGVLPPGIAGYSPEAKALDHDPATARELLAAAGHPSGEGLPPIRMLNASQSPSALRVLERIRTDLHDVGIKLEVVQVSWAELSDQLENRTAEAFLLAWVADMTDPDAFLRSLFEPGGSGNYFGHRSEETERLLEQGTRELNPVERASIYRRLERHVLQQAPLVPLYHTVGVVAVRSNVRGFTPTPLGVARVDLEKVWIRPEGNPPRNAG